MVRIYQEFLMFYQFFLSPPVKRSLIISNKLVYMSCLTSCQSTYDLGSQKIRKVQNNVKTSWNYNLLPSLSPKKEILSVIAKGSFNIEKNFAKQNFSCSVLFYMKARVLLKYFVFGCLWKQIFASNLPQGPFKRDLCDNCGNSDAFNTV